MTINSVSIPSVLERPVVGTELELLLYFRRAIAIPLAADIDMLGDCIVSAATLAVRAIDEILAIAAELPSSSHGGLPSLDYDTLLTASRLAAAGKLAEAYDSLGSVKPAPKDTAELLARLAVLYTSTTLLAANISTAFAGVDRLLANARIPELFAQGAATSLDDLWRSDGYYANDIRHEVLGASTAHEIFSILPSATRYRKSDSVAVTGTPAVANASLRFLPALLTSSSSIVVNGETVAIPASSRAYVEFDASVLKCTTDRVFYGVYPDLPQLRDNASVSMHIYRADGTEVTGGSPAAAGDVLYISYTYSLLTNGTRTLSVTFDNETTTYDMSGTVVSPLTLADPATLCAALVTAGAGATLNGSVIRVTAPTGVYSATIPTTTAVRLLPGSFDATWSAAPVSVNDVLGATLAPLTTALAGKIRYEDLDLPEILAAYTAATIPTTVTASLEDTTRVTLDSLAAQVGDTLEFPRGGKLFTFRVEQVDGYEVELDSDVIMGTDSEFSVAGTLRRSYLVAEDAGSITVTGHVATSATAAAAVVQIDPRNLQVVRTGDRLLSSGEIASVTGVHPVLTLDSADFTAEAASLESGFLRAIGRSALLTTFASAHSQTELPGLIKAAAALAQKSTAAALFNQYIVDLGPLRDELVRITQLGTKTRLFKLVQACEEARLPVIARYLKTANFIKLADLQLADLGQSTSI